MKRIALPVVALAWTAASCAAGDALPVLTLGADVTEVPADGMSLVNLAANVADAPEGAVVTFDVQGPGLLSATNAQVLAGVASVSLFAPFEDELVSATDGSSTSTVHAHLLVDAVDLQAALPIHFAIPADGAPVLTAHTEPDRVVAGGLDPITLVIEGRRLPGSTVTLTSSSDGVVLPSTLALTDNGSGLASGSVIIPAPATPAEVSVHVAMEGVAGVDTVLHFISVDAPAFDLSGTFAQVQYGVVEIGGLIFLSPDPQCVVAPTVSLVHVTQSGAHLTLASETCNIQMPTVNVVLIGATSTTVGPGFVAAANAHGTGPLEIDLEDVGSGASFNVPESALSHPLIVGASLARETDALPTSPDDSRVVDDDGDGNPGVTISNSSQGDQFIVYRTRTTSMTGTIAGSDLITGSTSALAESNVLNGGGITPTVANKASPYSMVRVDGTNGSVDISARDGDRSAITCADVLAFAAELQAQAPAPNSSTACQ